MKQEKFWQLGFEQRTSTVVLAFGKPNLISFFSSRKKGKLGRFIFRPLWLFKDVQNSYPKNPKNTLTQKLRRELRGEGVFAAKSRISAISYLISFFYFLPSFCLFMMYSHITMLG